MQDPVLTCISRARIIQSMEVPQYLKGMNTIKVSYDLFNLFRSATNRLETPKHASVYE